MNRETKNTIVPGTGILRLSEREEVSKTYLRIIEEIADLDLQGLEGFKASLEADLKLVGPVTKHLIEAALAQVTTLISNRSSK